MLPSRRYRLMPQIDVHCAVQCISDAPMMVPFACGTLSPPASKNSVPEGPEHPTGEGSGVKHFHPIIVDSPIKGLRFDSCTVLYFHPISTARLQTGDVQPLTRLLSGGQSSLDMLLAICGSHHETCFFELSLATRNSGGLQVIASQPAASPEPKFPSQASRHETWPAAKSEREPVRKRTVPLSLLVLRYQMGTLGTGKGLQLLGGLLGGLLGRNGLYEIRKGAMRGPARRKWRTRKPMQLCHCGNWQVRMPPVHVDER
ncbi:hypothetical protein VTL71DRAFT_12628 [Oculimacula yallundae]|uniref:Uncharacterized protein n=1 Tax=Oculimacula yallundae TaxID=86028 RepID=A0ABR4CPW0_9HELO